MKKFDVKKCIWPAVLVFLGAFAGLRTANGALHFADPVIMLVSILMPTPYALVSVGVGSLAADLARGFYLLAPATFVIKLLMVLAVKGLQKTEKAKKFPEIITSPALLIPVPGYYLAKVVELLCREKGFSAFGEAAVTFRKDLVQAVGSILIYFLLYHIVTSFIEFRKSLRAKKAEEPQEEQE